MLSVSFHTLGCKLNQLETESIAEAFKKEGFSLVEWGQQADLYVINTCTVTSKAEQKARRIIRKALRDNPASCLIATGCYAQMEGPALQQLSADGRLFVVSGDLKALLLDLPAYLMDHGCASIDVIPLLHRWMNDAVVSDKERDRTVPYADPFRFDVQEYSYHSRAFLKIQDGCNNVCTFCRVRLARGRSVSLAAPVLLERLRELEGRGFAEAVLTGVNLNQYRDGTMDFTGLLEYLLAGTSDIALRISSTEPEGVDERFAAVFAHPRIRPHIHLSVQSGSDVVLRQMRRRYTAEQVAASVRLLRAAKGDLFIACDIITGFPGETEADFEATYRLCEACDFAWIHAFPYSPRPGTEAYSMAGHVPEALAGQRIERLLALAERGKTAYVRRWIGKTVQAVVEQGHPAQGRAAVTENYLKARLICEDGAALPQGRSSVRCLLLAPVETALSDAEESIDVLARIVPQEQRQ